MTAPVRIAVLTVSDRSFRGEREDRGGPAVAEAARRLLGAEVVGLLVVPDGKDDIAGNPAALPANGAARLSPAPAARRPGPLPSS